MFIVLEGIDGAGKTTQITLLENRLAASGRAAVVLHEPGGTGLGEQLAAILKHDREVSLAPESELLLFLASRAQLVREIIRPALESGRVVLCDRFSASTLAYQGYGRGLPLPDIQALLQFATGGLTPDLTILLNVPVGVGLERKRRARTSDANDLQLALFDRFEDEQVAFHERVRQGYLRLAAAAQEDRAPGRWLLIDGTPGPETVFQQVSGAVESVLIPETKPGTDR